MTPKDSLQNPWAGLASYEDPAISKRQLLFCGRDAESYDVARLIDNNFVITLYGRSGIGKTSLIQAGVFPLLRREQYTPLVVRFGIRSDVTRSFQDLLTDAIENSLRESGGTVRVVNVVDEQTDRQAPDYLWNYFARRQFIHADGGVTFPVTVFDQFEEVFRKPDDRQQAETLLAQLRYLADETHALPDRIVDGQPYSYDFNFRFVLVIREDDLYRLEDSIDNCSLATLKQFRYRLRSLSDRDAESVILTPGQGLLAEADQQRIVSAIIGTARSKEDGSISTNILSLLCSRLFEACRRSGAERITSQLADEFVKGNPFEQFYKEATAEFGSGVRSFIEYNLVDSAGRRDSVSESDFFKRVKNGIQLLEGDKQILQRSAVSSAEGKARIELLHDSFCEPIKKMRDKRKKRERMLWIFTLFAVTAFFASAIWYVWNQNRRMMENQARFVAEKAQVLLEEGKGDVAMLLLHEVLPEDLSAFFSWRPLVPEAEFVLRRVWNRERRILVEHTGAVYSVCFSPDSTRIVSASDDKTVRIWDAATGACLDTLVGHTDWVYSVCFSSDGTRIASASSDKTVRIWDAATGACLDTLVGHTNRVYSVCFSSDGTRIASASDDKTVRIWDAATGACLDTLVGHTSWVNSVCFSPDGTRIASASEDKTIRVWDAATGACLDTLVGHTGWVYSVCFSSDGTRIASASSDETVRIWDAATGACLDTFVGHTYWVNSVCFSPDGTRIASASGDGTIRIWDVFTQKCLETIKEEVICRSVCFSPDGTRIVFASGKTVHIWDIPQIEKKKLKDCFIYSSAAVSNFGVSLIASSRLDRNIYIWNVSSGECVDTLVGHTDRLNSVCFSSDGTRIASASDDKTVRIWNVSTGECVDTLGGHSMAVTSVSFSSDGTRIASASEDKTIRVWDVSTGVCLDSLEGHTQRVNSVSFNPDGRSIVSTSNDSTARLWNVYTKDMEILARNKGNATPSLALFSSKEDRIVEVIGNSVYILNDGKMKFSIYDTLINTASLSPDGNYFVSVSIKGTVRVHDVATSTCVKVLECKNGCEEGEHDFRYAFFSPDGRQVFAVSNNGVIHVWPFPPLQELLDQTRERFKNRKLTPQEKRLYYLD